MAAGRIAGMTKKNESAVPAAPRMAPWVASGGKAIQVNSARPRKVTGITAVVMMIVLFLRYSVNSFRTMARIRGFIALLRPARGRRLPESARPRRFEGPARRPERERR